MANKITALYFILRSVCLAPILVSFGVPTTGAAKFPYTLLAPKHLYFHATCV